MNEKSHGQHTGELGPEQRATAWEKLGAKHFDVVVIGGGVVGAGIALDAATRGLDVALVDARDLASGTSSRSSKMFHGGLRYLEQLDFGLSDTLPAEPAATAAAWPSSGGGAAARTPRRSGPATPSP